MNSQGRQRMPAEVAPPPVFNLPSRRRLMMQQLERHAELYADNDQVQEAAVDHYIDNGHSLQQESADDHGHQKLTNGSSLRAKYGLSAQNHTAYKDKKYTHDAPQAAAADHYGGDDHLQQQESAGADHYQKRGSNNVSALHAKYDLSNHSHTAYSDHHYDEYGEHYTNDDHLFQQEHGSTTMPSTLQAAQSHRAYNFHHHDKHVEHYTDDHHLMQQDFKADLNQKKGSRITPSTLQAAQAQAAELRALHSAMLNNYGIADRSSAVYNDYHHKQKQEDALLHKSRPKKVSKKKSKVYIDEDRVMQNSLSSTSSASSTADCFIRPPAHEYPIFMPSHEDMLLSKVDGHVNSMNRRSSVDNCEALMREERLNYIFDHDNKRSFSGTQYSDHSMHDNNISCLHESLNLPRRSASSLMHLHDNDDHVLRHMSLNLPQGSQHQLFNTTNYKQNPLFDHFHNNDEIASLYPMNSTLAGSSDCSSTKRFSDNNLHDTAPNKPMKAQADQYPYELKAAFTGRQRALLEFLSEEPSRMRAFHELAAMETPEYDKVQMQRSNQTDAPTLAEGNQSNSRRVKGKYNESTQNVDHPEGSASDHHLRHQSMNDLSPSSVPARVRQKLAHSLNIDHHDQTTIAGGVSCDKCKPLAGAHMAIGTLSDSRDLSATHPPANATSTAAAAPKEKPDQKKPSIKGWFFRGKKKHNNADLSNSQANPASDAATKDRTLITSGPSSVPKEIRSSASITSTAPATSHVFSTLEAEKELEVAMAMDLMELKVLQAKTKRDAAMAEVLELRLSMDSMAKKLVEVERHCVALKTQLMDANAMKHQDDQILSNHQHNAPGSVGMINTSDQLHVNKDDPDAAETPNTDHYESDSIDHREERRPAKGISMIRAGISSGYGGRSSSRSVQPSKDEFLNAVAEARVGIKQISRVVLQHIQESKGAGALLQAQMDHQMKAGRGIEEEEGAAGMKKKGIEGENWGPILMICKEAARREKAGMIGMSSSGRGRGVAYYVEALISGAFHEHFENVGFDKNAAHKILDPSQRALAFYHSFLKLAKLTPTELLTQPSPLYNPAFDRFCSRKMRAIGRTVGCSGRLWPDELARTFLSAARAVWILHHLAFAYHSRPPGIFRVAAQSAFDARFMEVLPSDHRHVSPSAHVLVSLMVMPGFFLPDDIIKCKVLAS